jgi:endonuclease G, mitochondrial
MNSGQTIHDQCAHIADAIETRYQLRTTERQSRLQAARTDGPLAAASRAEALARVAHLTIAEGRNLEATSGNYDIDQINFLSRGLKAARPVCRITNAGTSWGTGFLIAPGLLITNHHVLPDLDSAAACNAEFNCESDADDQPQPRQTYRLEPTRVFITSPENKLDFSIVAIADPHGTSRALGWLPLDPRENKIVQGEPAVSIQHPNQEDKKICLFDSELVDKLSAPSEPYLHYTTDTDKGSSGSPVFNRNWQVIALHHGSFTSHHTDTTTGIARKITVNEGIRISRLLLALKTGQDIQAASPEMVTEIAQLLLAPETLGNSRPQGPALGERPGHALNAMADTGARRAGERLTPESSATRIKTPALSHYSGRKGYRPNFLGTGDLSVPLPQLSPALQDDAAPLLRSRASSELKYSHYSVVMCASRRLAYFSACNLDGHTNPESFNRKRRLQLETSRDERDLERAADQWYYDPRMARDYQPTPELYDDALTRFDFGHITRRMDVVWGPSEEDMLLGSDDSFHMTNCSPQVSSYNQHGDWGSLEDAIARFARGTTRRPPTPRKVNIFSGPVFHPADTEILGVQVPASFWKVVSFEENGQLCALAFLTTQEALVQAEARKLESVRELVKKAFDSEWLSTVQAISRMTSLDFGPLLEADLFAAAGGQRERVTETVFARVFGSL